MMINNMDFPFLCYIQSIQANSVFQKTCASISLSLIKFMDHGLNFSKQHLQIQKFAGISLLLVTLADHSLNLALVGRIDVISVLRPH